MTGTATVERLRKFLALVVAGGLFGHALAQDAGEAEEPAEQEAAAETAPATQPGGEDAGEGDTAGDAADAESEAAGDPGIDPAFDPDIYDPELDDQTYEGDDDVFVPTEEIPADEPIPFPSDI
jgi:hypothetical protein